MKLLRCLTALVAVLLASCQTSLKPSGFLGKTDAVMKKEKGIPFSRSWKNPKANLSTYQEVVVRPMRTDGLRDLKGVARLNVRNATQRVKHDAAKLAALGTTELRKEIGRSPNRRVTVSQKPVRREGVMVVETNLVEVEPGRPSMQALNFVVPFTAFLNRHAIGIEGRLLDARTGGVLFAFSDLERAELSLLDVQRFTYYGVQRREMQRWAQHLRQVVESNGHDLIRDAFPIQVVNW